MASLSVYKFPFLSHKLAEFKSPNALTGVYVLPISVLSRQNKQTNFFDNMKYVFTRWKCS